MSTLRNKSIYHAIHAARLVQMSSKQKKRSYPFSSAMARWRKPKNRLARIGLKT